MLRYLLDTNICIYVIKHRPAQARERFNQHGPHLCTSSVVAAELYYGAARSGRPEHNLLQVESFLARLDILPFDENAAGHYGEIRADLARAGTPIGPYDLMIAAHARSRGLTVVTNNESEFTRVPGLLVENWV
ncbi:tRNA(fMet)-specific endonuclease VapC [Aquisalimonas asiatica]|uniref:Ribonuclease VapC n=1 Tax=Aquisalimonas asiatica TaxID=406100 RepID=A0A1H8VKL4_9GAMM|nr:type II toxin-antitoxin system VapC family toxin [Aquisalimonas asiatica]SEP15965.1 tRNA(fMet)-specific endonuclease VapC [Aquisalimonas asiatica]